jgi:COP9 signalosome complex subunit 1
MGNEDLGNLYRSIGELKASAKAFSRMRDYCTSSKHVAEMCLRIAVVSIELQDWMAASSNAFKIQNLRLKPEDAPGMSSKSAVATGLASLAQGQYRAAAGAFLTVDPSLGNSFSEVVTPNDVSVYGGLCALAALDRAELQARVLENSVFRSFLELEPHVRRAITLFCNSKYSQCLEILEAYKTDYLLDIHLQAQVPQLYQAVRSKCIVQYFIPFSCVTLATMADVFATEEKVMEIELIHMIQEGALQARIDTQKRV